MGKGSGMKMPLLVAGIFSKLRGSAGHSVPHCCGKQSQGCSQKSSGCDVLGSSKTKGCKASCRSTMSGCKFKKITSTSRPSRVHEISTASKIQNTHGVHTNKYLRDILCVYVYIYIYIYIIIHVARLSHQSLTHCIREVTRLATSHPFSMLKHTGHALPTDISTCWVFMPEHWPILDKSLIWQTISGFSQSNNISTHHYQLYIYILYDMFLLWSWCRKIVHAVSNHALGMKFALGSRANHIDHAQAMSTQNKLPGKAAASTTLDTDKLNWKTYIFSDAGGPNSEFCSNPEQRSSSSSQSSSHPVSNKWQSIITQARGEKRETQFRNIVFLTEKSLCKINPT